MRALLAGLVMALLFAGAAKATAPFISVDQAGPYAVGDVVTLTVEVPKLKGYEYPVVLMYCDFGSGQEWTGYFRRWDDRGYAYPILSGPEPITLIYATDCHFELWAYRGLHSGGPDFLASTAVFTVAP